MLSCSTFCYRKLDPNIDRSVKLFGEFTLERALCGISHAGFKYVELASDPGMCHHVMPEQMTEEGFERLSILLEEFGLEPVAISGHVTMMDKDPSKERREIELLRKRIELAGRLKTRVVVTRTTDPMISDVSAVFSKAEIERFYDNVKGVIDCCRNSNVVLAIENDGGITVTADSALEAMRRIDSEYIRVNYDTASMPIRFGLQPEEDLRKLLKYVVHVHIKDQRGGKGAYVFPAIGEGELNFNNILDILRNYGYKGAFSVETGFGKGDRMKSGCEKPEEVDEILRRSYKYLERYRWLFQ
nr:sugar phosphate isomerase/epimerase family protein [Candidatus Njordarchaeum guaymaensis]